MITFETLWVKEDASGTLCAVCEEPIYFKANALYITIDDRTIDVNVKVCESCFDLIKKDAISE